MDMMEVADTNSAFMKENLFPTRVSTQTQLPWQTDSDLKLPRFQKHAGVTSLLGVIDLTF